MPPAKLACKGCRLSKVKCDLEHKDSGKCSRCERLGLACLPTGPSKRGRPHPARDVSRLGPAVRKLLVSGNSDDIDDDNTLAALGPHRKHMQVDKVVCKRDMRTEACRVLTSQLQTREARWAWMRHILYITQRARSIEGMANSFMSAHEMGFTLDEVQSAIQEVDPAELPDDEPLPAFLTEWYTADQISLTRFQNAGCMEWIPSRAFAEVFGVEGKLDAGMINMLESAKDREHIVSITGRLWAQVRSGPEADALPQHVQVEGDRDLEFTLKKGGKKVGPFRLRGRIVVKDRSLKTWTCINLVPVQRKLPSPQPPLMLTYPTGLKGEATAPPGWQPSIQVGQLQPHNDGLVLDVPTPHASNYSPAVSHLHSGTSPTESHARSADDHSKHPRSVVAPTDDANSGAGAGAAVAMDETADEFIPLADLDALFTGEDNFDMNMEELQEMAASQELPLDQLLALVTTDGTA
mmetsp:Transcript_17488/g.47188  ORF Transcript_17488/g.47188 Transcript_17488/m.47188 type:complete len:465 (+) Transcript_17488:129-1523(+)